MAANGAAALDLVPHWQPQLIVLDLVMGTMNGWGFAEAYRQLPTSPVPILLITAAAAGAEHARQEIGAAEVLTKPFELGDLLALVRVYTRFRETLGGTASAG